MTGYRHFTKYKRSDFSRRGKPDRSVIDDPRPGEDGYYHYTKGFRSLTKYERMQREGRI